MPLIKRTEFQTLLKKNDFAVSSQVFLLFGERFLCKETADLLEKHLLKDTTGAIHAIDGDLEDPGHTLARLMSFSLLPGKQIYHVTNSRIFHSKTVLSEIWAKAMVADLAGRPEPALRHLLNMLQTADVDNEGQTVLSEIPSPEWKKLFGFEKPAEGLERADKLLSESTHAASPPGANITDRFVEIFDKRLPPDNILLLTAETVDKRQRLFTYIKKNGTVIDCSVAVGAGVAAQNEQREILKGLMLKTLTGFGKKIDPRAVPLFFEKVGFHPVAIVVETEKLAHYVGDRDIITSEDLDEIVGRSREDALFELTDAFSKRQISRTLTILIRLQEQGIHELAILATMRNFLRKQLFYRSLQMRDTPRWHKSMNANEFQNSYLPALKNDGVWKEMLQGHPYALFMNFTRASNFTCSGLKQWLALLLDTEFRLKGSPLPVQLVLEELFLSLLKATK